LRSILRASLEISRLTRNWRLWGKKIAKAARKTLGDCEVYVFGSVVSGCPTAASDVDILIVCGQLPEDGRSRGNIKARIEEASQLPLYHPFEIHLATRKEAETNPIYRRVIQEGIRIPASTTKAS
jgi:predicted nucleotidyltransferase